MGLNKYTLVVLWYLLPLLYLTFVEGLFVPVGFSIVITFLVTFTLGFFLFHQVETKPSKRDYSVLLDGFFKFIFWFTLVVLLYGFYRLAVDGFNVASYRKEFYESTGGIFKSTYLFTLYNVFLMPLFLVGTMYFMSRDFAIKAIRKLIIFSFIIIVLDGILRLGRFQYLFVFFFLYLTYRKFGIGKIAIIIGAVIILVISFVTIYFRQFYIDAAVESGLDIVNKDVFRNSIANYQYNGFVMLDNMVADKPILGRFWEGNTPSFLWLFGKTITSKIGFDFNYPWEQYNIILTEGMYSDKLGLMFNAFSTNFLPVYLDLGYLGVMLYGIFCGAFVGLKTTNPVIKTVQYVNLFVIVFGLYQPIITTLPGFIVLIAYCIAFFQLITLYKSSKQVKQQGNQVSEMVIENN